MYVLFDCLENGKTAQQVQSIQRGPHRRIIDPIGGRK